MNTGVNSNTTSSRVGAAGAGLAAVLLACTLPAQAENSRWYATLDAGIGFLGSEDLNYRDATTNVTAEADYSPLTVTAGIGWRF